MIGGPTDFRCAFDGLGCSTCPRRLASRPFFSGLPPTISFAPRIKVHALRCPQPPPPPPPNPSVAVLWPRRCPWCANRLHRHVACWPFPANHLTFLTARRGPVVSGGFPTSCLAGRHHSSFRTRYFFSLDRPLSTYRSGPMRYATGSSLLVVAMHVSPIPSCRVSFWTWWLNASTDCGAISASLFSPLCFFFSPTTPDSV